jgi:putative PIN family toxin of toxin-antitoxin system
MKIVLDTNVLVSGLLNRHGPPGRIDLVVDERILAEYSRVLARPRLRIPSDEAHSTLTFIAVTSCRVAPVPLDVPASTVPDPKDLPFAEAAVSGGAQALVTGNEKHFSFAEEFGVKVLNPQIFLKMAA